MKLTSCLALPAVTPAGSFGMFAGVGALTWLFAYFQLPELSGVSLNDVQSAFGEGERSGSQSNAGYTAVGGQENEDEPDEWDAR